MALFVQTVAVWQPGMRVTWRCGCCRQQHDAYAPVWFRLRSTAFRTDGTLKRRDTVPACLRTTVSISDRSTSATARQRSNTAKLKRKCCPDRLISTRNGQGQQSGARGLGPSHCGFKSLAMVQPGQWQRGLAARRGGVHGRPTAQGAPRRRRREGVRRQRHPAAKQLGCGRRGEWQQVEGGRGDARLKSRHCRFVSESERQLVGRQGRHASGGSKCGITADSGRPSASFVRHAALTSSTTPKAVARCCCNILHVSRSPSRTVPQLEITSCFQPPSQPPTARSSGLQLRTATTHCWLAC